MDRLVKSEWRVDRIEARQGRELIAREHYAHGASNTATFVFGLFHRGLPDLVAGVTWWLPPTLAAARSVRPADPHAVLALSRMVIDARVVKNACTFLLARSVRAIRRDGRFKSLVTYADESQGHQGGVYRAAGWTYCGLATPKRRYVDPATGRQVSAVAPLRKEGRLTTQGRSHEWMLAQGYVCEGSFAKHKYVLHLQ